MQRKIESGPKMQALLRSRGTPRDVATKLYLTILSRSPTEEELRAMQAQVRDRNFRIFTDDDNIYVFNNKLFIKSTDLKAIWSQLGVEDASHAFYLGRELQKAALAVRLGKRYMQETELRWGYLGG